MKRSLSLLVVFTLLLSLSMVFVYGEPVADVDKVETAVEEVIVDTESVVEEKEVVKEDGEKKADEKAEEATEEKKEEVADEKVVATDGAKVEIAEEVTEDEAEDEAVVDEEVVEEEEERGVMSHDPMPAEDTPITEAPKVEFVHPSDLPADEALAMYNNFTISEKLTVYPILKVSVVLDYIFFFVFLAYCLFYILHLLYVLVKGKGLRKNLSLRGFLLFVVCAIFLVLQMNNMYVTMITEILIKSRLVG